MAFWILIIAVFVVSGVFLALAVHERSRDTLIGAGLFFLGGIAFIIFALFFLK